MISKRNQWIDFIRGLVIICVVFEHACERVGVFIPMQNLTLDLIRESIKTFQMASLFAISGFLYAARERVKVRMGDFTELRNFMKKKIWDLLLPYSFFAILIWIGKMIFSEDVLYQVGLKDLLLMYFDPISFAWFLYALFIYAVLCAFFDKILKKSTCFMVISSTLLTVFSCLIVNSEMYLNKIVYYGVFYVMGILLYEHSMWGRKKNALLFAGAYVVFFGIYFMYKEYVILFFICGVLFVLVIFEGFLCDKSKKSRAVSLIGFLGTQSLYIYIMHPVIQSGLRKLFIEIGVINKSLWLLIFTISGIIIPLIYFFVSEKIKILKVPFKPRQFFSQMRAKNE